MFTNQMLIALVGIPSAIALYYWFWQTMEKKEKAKLRRNQIQEANIRIKGGYNPDVITAKAGQLLHVNFLREELSYCSEEIIFPDFDRRIRLPEFRVVSTEFFPKNPGEYGFQCGKGKWKGKLVVVR